jgi:hypothetical protein
MGLFSRSATVPQHNLSKITHTQVEEDGADNEGLDGEGSLGLLSSELGLAELWWCYGKKLAIKYDE